MDNEEVVLEIIKKVEKSLKSVGIVEMTGIPKKEIDKIIKKLKKEGKIVSPKRCYYAPAE